MPHRFTSEQIIEAYKGTGSVWKAAKLLGICGQSVWERLKRLDYELVNENWSAEEIGELKQISSQCTLGEVARRLGRSYASVACKVSELGVGVRYGNRIGGRLKRGSGLTKSVVGQYRRQLGNWDGSVKQFCIQRGIDLELFVQALQRYDPEFWDSYVRDHSDLALVSCPQCNRQFIPMSGKQKTCSRRCGSLLRSDRKYFGGKRINTIGLAEGICQLCDREKRALSSHHIFGKENDPENDFLIALCAGCHRLVTLMASRTDIANPSFLENLISLCVARKFGAQRPLGFHVCVQIDELTEADFESRDDAVRSFEKLEKEGRPVSSASSPERKQTSPLVSV